MAVLGIGTYCWTEPSRGGLCVDAVGPVTGSQALVVPRGAGVTVANPAAGTTIREGSVNAWQAPPQPLSTTGAELVWSLQPGTGRRLDASVSADRVEFGLDLPPGRYVVEIRLFFAAGDVSYGLLAEVR